MTFSNNSIPPSELVWSLSQLVAGELSWSTPEFEGPLAPSFWATTKCRQFEIHLLMGRANWTAQGTKDFVQFLGNMVHPTRNLRFRRVYTTNVWWSWGWFLGFDITFFEYLLAWCSWCSASGKVCGDCDVTVPNIFVGDAQNSQGMWVRGQLVFYQTTSGEV